MVVLTNVWCSGKQFLRCANYCCSPRGEQRKQPGQFGSYLPFLILWGHYSWNSKTKTEFQVYKDQCRQKTISFFSAMLISIFAFFIFFNNFHYLSTKTQFRTVKFIRFLLQKKNKDLDRTVLCYITMIKHVKNKIKMYKSKTKQRQGQKHVQM